MRRILLSLVMIFAVVALVTFSTQALFSDTEEVLGNTFAAGQLDLELNFGEEVTLPFSVDGIAPGDSGRGKVTLISKDGNLDGEITINIENLTQLENSCIEPEVSAGDPCGEGDLGLGLQMAMFLDVDQDGAYDQTNGDIEIEYSGNTNTTSGLQFAVVPEFEPDIWSDVLLMDGGDSVDLVIEWRLPTTWSYPKSQEILMTDSLSFDVVVTLEQAD